MNPNVKDIRLWEEDKDSRKNRRFGSLDIARIHSLVRLINTLKSIDLITYDNTFENACILPNSKSRLPCK